MRKYQFMVAFGYYKIFNYWVQFAYLIDICQVSTMWAGAVLSTGVADVIKMGTVPVLL